MKKHAINYSWPATLSFSADNGNENELFSRGKLKVFYQGETDDHRYFSSDFSKQLINSLPYTPIISYYDEEADDFVGHATEQNIYGIVDPRGEVSFETDDKGITWCVCDTVYYTERPDKVGTIAKKIEGHSQSLELDPKSVKYTVNYDEKRHFKNIEFTAGKFVGVSVLGKDQKPAFTGSSFFSLDQQFEEKMKLLRDYCEAKNDQNNGGKAMNFPEFMKLSWGDISIKVDEALYAEYSEEAYTYVVDMFEDSAIVRFYSYIDGSIKLMRVKYSCDDNGVVTLGNVNEVHITYEDIPNPITETGVDQATSLEKEQFTDAENSAADTIANEAQNNEDANGTCEPDNTVNTDNAVNTDNSNNSDITTDQVTNNVDNVDNANNVDTAFQQPVSLDTDAQVTKTPKASVDNEQDQEENTSSAAFAESERAEFEALKREKKINLLSSYEEYLTDEEVVDFESKLDSLNYDELEVALLKKYKSYQEHQKPMRAFTLSAPQKSNVDTLDDFVRRTLSR